MTGRNINRDIIMHHSNYDLADYTVYVKDKSPDAIAQEILNILKNGD